MVSKTAQAIIRLAQVEKNDELQRILNGITLEKVAYVYKLLKIINSVTTATFET